MEDTSGLTAGKILKIKEIIMILTDQVSTRLERPAEAMETIIACTKNIGRMRMTIEDKAEAPIALKKWILMKNRT
jgi:hypothetical protein